MNDEIETEENTTKLIKEDESIKLVNKLESKAEKKERKRKEKMEKNLCKVELLDSATTSSETQFKDSKPIIQDLACDLISPILNPSKDSCIKTATENFEKIEQILSLKVLPKQTSKLVMNHIYYFRLTTINR